MTKQANRALVRYQASFAARLARVSLLALLAALSFARAPSARADYAVLEAPEFRIIYSAPALSYLAPYAARCYANSMRFHGSLFGYAPHEKVTIYLADGVDYGNAGVAGAPRTTLSMDIAPSNFVYESGPSNERMNFTMNHEGVHVVAVDQATGSDKFFRSLFHGKIKETNEHPETMVYSWLTLPRRAAPRWYHEGAAVFFETWMAGGIGRAQGPYDEMVFRSMVRDSARIYDPLGLESEGTKVDFQVGVNSYLYGTRFVSYLADTYGPETIVSWVGRRPGTARSVAGQFHRVFGRSLDQGWREWTAWERGFQSANLDSLRRYPITPYRDLSPRALGSVSNAILDRGNKTIYAGVQYPGTFAHVAAITLGGGDPRRIHDVKGAALYFVTSLAGDPKTGRLFYTTDNNAWRDLCALDLATGKSKTLIKNLRAGDLAWNPADSTLWGVRHYNGISTLIRVPPPYDDWYRVFSLPYGQDLYDLAVSPDGTRLSGSFAEVNGRQTLRLMRTSGLTASDTSMTVLHDFGASIPTGFVFSEDGRYLYGSSYYTGVSNIWRYDLESRAMEIVTNTDTGFFRPIPLGGDSLLVFRYTGQGFVPALVTDARPLNDVSAITYLGARIAERYPVVRSWKVPPPSSISIDSLVTGSGPYHRWGVGMTGIYPIVEGYKVYTAVGLATSMSDPLGFNRITLSASYSPTTGLPEGERWHLRGQYKRPYWTFGAGWNPASFYDLGGPTKTGLKGYGGSAEYERTLLDERPREVKLTAGVAGYGGLDRLPSYQNIGIPPGFDFLVATHADLAYKNVGASIGAIDVERGVKASLEVNQDLVRQGYASDSWWKGYPLGVATLELGAPGLFTNGSIWLRGAAGMSPGDRDDPFANFYFGGFGNNIVDHGDPKRYRYYYAFPGIELNEVGGRNFTKAMIDWNLPGIRFRRLGWLDFYATWARLSVFANGLVTNLDDEASRRSLVGAGAQLDIRFQLFTMQPLTLSGGVARALERDEPPKNEYMISLKIL
ncbi:MAG TPA: hypothetical protein VFS09_03280 [Candidatus Eisenbacteria bacterium]|nr:hypothetical protein [Candidatus Eisenbacteria bacterium]